MAALRRCGAHPDTLPNSRSAHPRIAPIRIRVVARLRAGEAQGTPISAKFEIEGEKLQLSIYTMKGNDFMEVVADPKTGAIAKAEKITDTDDLKPALVAFSIGRR